MTLLAEHRCGTLNGEQRSFFSFVVENVDTRKNTTGLATVIITANKNLARIQLWRKTHTPQNGNKRQLSVDSSSLTPFRRFPLHRSQEITTIMLRHCHRLVAISRQSFCDWASLGHVIPEFLSFPGDVFSRVSPPRPSQCHDLSLNRFRFPPPDERSLFFSVTFSPSTLAAYSVPLPRAFSLSLSLSVLDHRPSPSPPSLSPPSISVLVASS